MYIVNTDFIDFRLRTKAKRFIKLCLEEGKKNKKIDKMIHSQVSARSRQQKIIIGRSRLNIIKLLNIKYEIWLLIIGRPGCGPSRF